MKGKKLKRPYSKYRGYKIFHKTQGRYYVCMVKIKTGKRKTISYARYKMAVFLGRRLTSDETVDHKDENKINDKLSNLQILTRAENIKKNVIATGRKTKLVKLKCFVCDKEFYRPPRNVNHKLSKGKRITCSRRCGGILSHWE